jgi:hypothetical protein
VKAGAAPIISSFTALVAFSTAIATTTIFRPAWVKRARIAATLAVVAAVEEAARDAYARAVPLVVVATGRRAETEIQAHAA